MACADFVYLVAASLGISAAVLLATLLAPDALRLSAFPALLLLTTLLRLAVAVASTRLVLTRGEAGRVIEALGRVVMQGSWVAGAVVLVSGEGEGVSFVGGGR